MPVKRIPLEGVAIRAARREQMVAQNAERVAVETTVNEPEPTVVDPERTVAQALGEQIEEPTQLAGETHVAKPTRTVRPKTAEKKTRGSGAKSGSKKSG